jgi:hypothetical protein
MKHTGRWRALVHRKNVVILVAVAGIFAVSGIGLLLLTSAATFTASSEAEAGNVSRSSLVVNDASASGGRSVRFAPATGGSGFVHPGIVNGQAGLNFVKTKVAAGAQPWKTAYDRAVSSRAGSLSYAPAPIASVQCGNGGSTLNVGCDAQRNDAAAAYTHAVLWYHSGNQAHADKAKQIMNAWASTHTSTPWNGTATYGNNKLQTGWAGSNFLKAAEIIRYSNAGWSASDIAKFETYMENVYLPLTIDGWQGFNWITLLADTTMDIGVFINDRAVFTNGLDDMRRAVPAYVYMSSDGSAPSNASGWNGATTFTSGITQETCRDLSHSAMGVASIMYSAETARLQAVDYYEEQRSRLQAMVEFHAEAVRHLEAKAANASYVIPSKFCGGTLKSGGSGYTVTGDVALNHFANRLGLPMTDQRSYVLKYRPMSNTTNLHMQLETLTHADIGNL